MTIIDAMAFRLHFTDQYQLFTLGNSVTIESNWTGNKLVFGQAGKKTPFNFYWNQPVQWQYRIIGLESRNHKLHDWEYGIWRIGAVGLEESTGNLTVFNDTGQSECKCSAALLNKLHGMVGLLAVIVLLLLV